MRNKKRNITELERILKTHYARIAFKIYKKIKVEPLRKVNKI